MKKLLSLVALFVAGGVSEAATNVYGYFTDPTGAPLTGNVVITPQWPAYILGTNIASRKTITLPLTNGGFHTPLNANKYQIDWGQDSTTFDVSTNDGSYDISVLATNLPTPLYNVVVYSAPAVTNVTISGGSGTDATNFLLRPLLVIGDSMSDYDGTCQGNGWVHMLQTNTSFGPYVSIRNAAKSGDTIGLDVTNWTARYDWYLKNMVNRSNSWAIVFKGLNDILISDTTANITTNLYRVYTNLHGYGFKVCAMTICKETTNAISVAVNQWITTANPNIDLVLDIASQNPTYSGCDGHIDTNFSYIVVSNVLAAIPVQPVAQGFNTFLGGIRQFNGPNNYDRVNTFDGQMIIRNNSRLGWWSEGYAQPLEIIQPSVRAEGTGLGLYTYGAERVRIPATSTDPIEMFTGGLSVTGAVIATSFIGDGSALTGITSTNGISLADATNAARGVMVWTNPVVHSELSGLTNQWKSDATNAATTATNSLAAGLMSNQNVFTGSNYFGTNVVFGGPVSIVNGVDTTTVSNLVASGTITGNGAGLTNVVSLGAVSNAAVTFQGSNVIASAGIALGGIGITNGTIRGPINLVMDGTVQAYSGITVNLASGYLNWAGRSVVKSSGDGNIDFLNANQNGFSKLTFGPSSDWPALRSITNASGARLELNGTLSATNGIILPGGPLIISNTAAASQPYVQADTNGNLTASGTITGNGAGLTNIVNLGTVTNAVMLNSNLTANGAGSNYFGGVTKFASTVYNNDYSQILWGSGALQKGIKGVSGDLYINSFSVLPESLDNINIGSPTKYWSNLYAASVTLRGTLTATNGIILPGSSAVVKFVSIASSNPPTSGSGTAFLFGATNAAGTAEIFTMDGAGVIKQISEHAMDAPDALIDDSDEAPNISKEVLLYTGKVRWINRSRNARLAELSTKVQLNSLANYQFLTGKTSTQWSNANAFQAYTNALYKLDGMTAGERQIVMVESFAEYNTRLGLTNGNGLVKLRWSDVQARLQAEYATGYTNALTAYTNAVSAGDTNAVAPVWNPPPVEPIPSWLQKRGAN